MRPLTFSERVRAQLIETEDLVLLPPWDLARALRRTTSELEMAILQNDRAKILDLTVDLAATAGLIAVKSNALPGVDEED